MRCHELPARTGFARRFCVRAGTGRFTSRVRRMLVGSAPGGRRRCGDRRSRMSPSLAIQDDLARPAGWRPPRGAHTRNVVSAAAGGRRRGVIFRGPFEDEVPRGHSGAVPGGNRAPSTSKQAAARPPSSATRPPSSTARRLCRLSSGRCPQPGRRPHPWKRRWPAPRPSVWRWPCRIKTPPTRALSTPVAGSSLRKRQPLCDRRQYAAKRRQPVGLDPGQIARQRGELA